MAEKSLIWHKTTTHSLLMKD